MGAQALPGNGSPLAKKETGMYGNHGSQRQVAELLKLT